MMYEFKSHICDLFGTQLGFMTSGFSQNLQVIERFWSVRKQAVGSCDTDKTQKKAAILLNESEGFWSYGETNKTLYDQASQARANLVQLQS